MVLASSAPLDLPAARIPDPQAQHLLAKLLVKRPKERAPLEAVLRHAFLVGGLDTQQVGSSFHVLFESQVSFKEDLERLKSGLGQPGATGSMKASVFGSSPSTSFMSGHARGAAQAQPGKSSFKRSGSNLADKHTKFAQG